MYIYIHTFFRTSVFILSSHANLLHSHLICYYKHMLFLSLLESRTGLYTNHCRLSFVVL